MPERNPATPPTTAVHAPQDGSGGRIRSVSLTFPQAGLQGQSTSTVRCTVGAALPPLSLTS